MKMGKIARQKTTESRGVQSLEIQLLTTGWRKIVGSKTGDTETVPKITVYPQ